ncbi:hypothetical protein ACDX78_19315 [Virgibacillus oceani]
MIEGDDTEHIGSGDTVACSTPVDLSQQPDSQRSFLLIGKRGGLGRRYGPPYRQGCKPIIKHKDKKRAEVCAEGGFAR